MTPVLGGGWRDVLAGGVGRPRRRRDRAARAPRGADRGDARAARRARRELLRGRDRRRSGSHVSPDVVTLAALVTLLPGMALTIGVRELATEHLQSGVANTAMALVQLLGLVFGVGVGRSIAASWFGAPEQAVPHTGFTGTHVLAAIAVGTRVHGDAARAGAGRADHVRGDGARGRSRTPAGRALFGAAAGVFVAALAIGVIGGCSSGMLRRSPLVFIVPGVLILVPGSAGFNSLLKLLTGQTVSGIDAGFNTFVTAMSIAYGLMLSTVVLPRRFTRSAGNALESASSRHLRARLGRTASPAWASSRRRRSPRSSSTRTRRP